MIRLFKNTHLTVVSQLHATVKNLPGLLLAAGDILFTVSCSD